MGHLGDAGDGESHFSNDPDTKKQTTKCIIWTALAVCLIICGKNKTSKNWICFWSRIQDRRFVGSKQILMMVTTRLDSQMQCPSS